MTARQEHWETVYATRRSTEVSWYEPDPATSLRLIGRLAPPPASVVDVGGGASTLVDRLLDAGYTPVTVLDVSAHALDEVRARLGPRAGHVRLVHADVLVWEPAEQLDVWHDRAAFHFLTDAADRRRYVETAAAAVRPGGALVVATFAADGPTQCSGLPVCRYSPAALAQELAPHFVPVADEVADHVTPAGNVQPFTWVSLRRDA